MPTKAPIFAHRHYVVIARLMGESETHAKFAAALMQFMILENPKFNRARFRKAMLDAKAAKLQQPGVYILDEID